MSRALYVRCKQNAWSIYTHVQKQGLMSTEDGMTSQCQHSSRFWSLYFYALNYPVNPVLSKVCPTGWQERQQRVTSSFAQKKRNTFPGDENVSSRSLPNRSGLEMCEESRISSNGRRWVEHRTSVGEWQIRWVLKCCSKHLVSEWSRFVMAL